MHPNPVTSSRRRRKATSNRHATITPAFARKVAWLLQACTDRNEADRDLHDSSDAVHDGCPSKYEIGRKTHYPDGTVEARLDVREQTAAFRLDVVELQF